MRIEPKKIMCAVDFSEFTPQVISYGKAMAEEFGARLTLCHVVSNMVRVSSAGQAYMISEQIEEERQKDSRNMLESLSEKFDIPCDIIVPTGHPADMIARTAEKAGIDMVIAATYGGSGVKRFLVGSVTDRLVKILSCPLLVLHGNEEPEAATGTIHLKRILVGCDFSPDSSLAFDYALSLAQEFQAELFLAHVIRPSERIEFTSTDYTRIQSVDYTAWAPMEPLAAHPKLENREHQARDRLFKRVENQLIKMIPEDCQNWCTPIAAVLEGEPYKELIQFAEDKSMDMVVLGIRGHSLLERFLVGATTDRVISRANCPVLAVRQTG